MRSRTQPSSLAMPRSLGCELSELVDFDLLVASQRELRLVEEEHLARKLEACQSLLEVTDDILFADITIASAKSQESGVPNSGDSY